MDHYCEENLQLCRREEEKICPQESARKDVEHAFGVLQSRWGIVSILLELEAPKSYEK